MKITRRGVLLGTMALIGTGAAASVLACRPKTGRQATLDPERLRMALADIIAPEQIGRAYGAGRTRHELLAELEARPGLAKAAVQDCPETMRRLLRDQVREDFRSGDVLVAARFVVARSECILAAMVV